MHHLRLCIGSTSPSESCEGVSLGRPLDAMHDAHIPDEALAGIAFATQRAERKAWWRQYAVVGKKGVRTNYDGNGVDGDSALTTGMGELELCTDMARGRDSVVYTVSDSARGGP